MTVKEHTKHVKKSCGPLSFSERNRGWASSFQNEWANCLIKKYETFDKISGVYGGIISRNN